jgi:hypothetical protein
VLSVAFVGMLVGTGIVGAFIATRPSPCCGDQRPFASIYHEPLSRLDVVLTAGDGHAFAVIAQDPLLQRPEVLEDPADLAYRAQRPVWGYLTWVGSLGQARFTGWVLAVLTVLSCGSACAMAAVLLLQRARSPWWALLVPFLGFETLTELTPELFAVTLLALGLLLWQADRRALGVSLFCVAALTRETMLVGVAALGLWELAHRAGPLLARVRHVLPLAIPLCVYVGWIAFLRIRLGNWPFNRSDQRLSIPGGGLADALRRIDDSGTIVFWVVVAMVLCGGLLLACRHDVLSWMAFAFALFGALLGSDVWLTNAGYQRALVPLFFFGSVALVGGLPLASRARGRSPVDSGSRELVGPT